MPRFGRKVCHLRCDSHTSFKVKRLKVRVTRRIIADTHRAPYLLNGKALRTASLVYGWRTTTRNPHQPQVPWQVKDLGHKVTWSVWAVLAQWPINRKLIAILSPKLVGGYPMTRATLCTSFEVSSKVSVTGRLTQTHKMCHIFWTVRPKYFKVGLRMQDVDPRERQAP